MGAPDQSSVWFGLDIGKTEHVADVLDEAGSPLFAGGVVGGEEFAGDGGQGVEVAAAGNVGVGRSPEPVDVGAVAE